MNDNNALVVRVGLVHEGDAEEVAALARRLRAELLDLDVESVEPLTEDTVAEGAKGLPGLAGVLGVQLGKAALASVVAKIRDWVTRNGRSVEVTIAGDTIKVTGITGAK